MSGLKIALLTLWAPVDALARAAAERRFAWALALATAAALGFSAVALPKVDFASAAEAQLEKKPDSAKMTPHERAEALRTATKVGVVGGVASSLAGPTLSVLLAALGLWLGFRVAGGRPGFAATFAVAAHAELPGALRQLLSLPALLRAPAGLQAGDLPRLLPSSLAALAPEGLALPKLALLGSVDLFALWSLALLALGMPAVAGVSRLRSAVVVLSLWISFVLVFRFALPTMAMAGKPS